ncbi:MAG: glycosyltransferase family 39 protein [Nannocystaceae bacterium]|nr:glycosyltransferase family 39 protein [Nannocystaceae bacterium]
MDSPADAPAVAPTGPRGLRWLRWLLSSPAGWATWVAIAVVAIDLGTIAMAGPWDPWETHYGEVARQIVVRHDPVDLWWQAGNGGPAGASETFFASKPALPFWLMALSMRIFGVGTSVDPAEMVHSPLPELALRLPSMLAGYAAALVLGATAWRLASPRAGVLAGAIVATMPQFAIVTRQALTDMFFVAPVVAAACAWALAWLQPDRALRRRGRGWRSLPFDRAYLAFFVAFVLAAIVPLAIIHQHAFDPWVWRAFGKVQRRAEGLLGIQRHMWIYWALCAAILVRSLRWQRRSQALMGILYLCAGLSLLGKGLIGPGLVGLLVLVHLIQSGRWQWLRQAGLPTGIALFVVVGFPWHHAMALYRGERWVNELIMDNNLRRFSTGEQKQAVGGFTYYLETLGLAALPWSAIVPIAGALGLRAFGRERAASAEPAPADRGDALLRFAILWLVVALFAITYSTTKYYHYILPVLPPAALVTALWLDRHANERGNPRSWTAWATTAVGLALVAVVVRDATHEPAWIAHLTTYLYTGMWTEGAPEVGALMLTCVPFALALVAWPWAPRVPCLTAMLLGAVLTRSWIIADYIPGASESWSQRSAMQVYFDGRGPEDRLVSWWFYYRGETFFSKANIFVMKENDRKVLSELVDEARGRGITLWFITTVQHANRLANQLPSDLRGGVERVYENFHYVLLKAPVP